VPIKYDEAPFASRLSTSNANREGKYYCFSKGSVSLGINDLHVATAIERYLLVLETNKSKV